MSAQQLIEEYIPLYEPADVHVNAKALRCMAEGIHYDTTPGELNREFAFVMHVERIDQPQPVYRWQRSLPGVRIIHGPRPKPRKHLAMAMV